jgi:hypothetical protein
MEVLTDLYKVDNTDKMRRTSHNKTEFLHGRDIRLGQRLTFHLQLRDTGGENVPLQPRDDFLVDILDGDEGIATS